MINRLLSSEGQFALYYDKMVKGKGWIYFLTLGTIVSIHGSTLMCLLLNNVRQIGASYLFLHGLSDKRTGRDRNKTNGLA